MNQGWAGQGRLAIRPRVPRRLGGWPDDLRKPARQRIVAIMRVREMRKLVRLRTVPLDAEDPAARRLLRHRRPAAGGQAADPAAGVRLRGRGGRRGDLGRGERGRLPLLAVPAPGAGRGGVGRHVGAWCSARPCRCRWCSAPTGYTRMLHPDGEIGAARSAAAARAAVHAVDDGDDRDRGAAGRGRGGPGGELWFQLYLTQRPGAVVRPGGPGRRQRVHGAGGHGGHDGGRQPRAGPAQRPVDPARADLATVASVAVKPGLLVPAAVRAGPRLRELRRAGPRRRSGSRRTSSTPT